MTVAHSSDSPFMVHIIQLACPGCGGPVFVPSDSDRELVACLSCDASLATARTLDGKVAITVRSPR